MKQYYSRSLLDLSQNAFVYALTRQPFNLPPYGTLTPEETARAEALRRVRRAEALRLARKRALRNWRRRTNAGQMRKEGYSEGYEDNSSSDW